MITLVTGGSGSGKSEYAEGLVLSSRGAHRWYVATMEAYGEEGRRKVERHRLQRAGKGFDTVECPRDLQRLRIPSKDGGAAVLLECISNLAANEMFGAVENVPEVPGTVTQKEKAALRAMSAVMEGVACLARQVETLVIVTNEVGCDGIDYEQETMDYIRLMGRINRRLAEMADRVVEVVFGIPVMLKGAADDCGAPEKGGKCL